MLLTQPAQEGLRSRRVPHQTPRLRANLRPRRTGQAGATCMPGTRLSEPGAGLSLPLQPGGTGRHPECGGQANHQLHHHPREAQQPGPLPALHVRCRWSRRPGRAYLWYRKPQLRYLNLADERDSDSIGKHQVV